MKRLYDHCVDCGKRKKKTRFERCHPCGRRQFYRAGQKRLYDHCADCGNKKKATSSELCPTCALEKRSRSSVWQVKMKLAGKKRARNKSWLMKIGAANRRKARDPKWKEKHKRMVQDPGWLMKIGAANRRKARDPKWKEKHKRACRNSRNSVWLKNTTAANRLKAQKPAWRRLHSLAMRRNRENPNWRRNNLAMLKQLHKRQIGPNHPCWRGGISRLPYSPEWDNRLKQLIRDRDHHTCQECSKRRARLNVHHIDYNKKNCDPKNLIALCGPCHIKTNFGDRAAWTRYYQSKIKSIYRKISCETSTQQEAVA